MSDNSPLFVGSLELLAHATEIFASRNPKKYKFVILHLANSIELILKDRVVDLGISIYEQNMNKTIGIWSCFSKLEDNKVSIPERPIIELLIDDRNTIQHRFGYPDEKTVFYYLCQVVAFFERFLKECYSVELSEALKEHLSDELLELLGLATNNFGEIDESGHLEKLAELSPGLAIVSAFRDIESYIVEILGLSSTNSEISKSEEQLIGDYRRLYKEPTMEALFRGLKVKGFLEQDAYATFQELRRLRNHFAHAPLDSIDENRLEIIQDMLKKAEGLIKGLQKAKKDGYRFLPGKIQTSSELSSASNTNQNK